MEKHETSITLPLFKPQPLRASGVRWILLMLMPALSPAAEETPKEVLTLWRQLPALAKSTPPQAYEKLHTWLPERGLRGLYTKAQFALNLAQLEKLSGQRIFRAGPHQNGALQLKAMGEFGHYNPAFLKWAGQHGIPGRQNALLRKELQPVYDRHLKQLARNFYRAYQLLQAEPVRATKAREGYLDRLAAEGKAGLWLQDFFRPETNRMNQQGHDWYETNVALGFWVRRKLDGSAPECHTLLLALLQTHDAVWLKKQQAN